MFVYLRGGVDLSIFIYWSGKMFIVFSHPRTQIIAAILKRDEKVG